MRFPGGGESNLSRGGTCESYRFFSPGFFFLFFPRPKGKPTRGKTTGCVTWSFIEKIRGEDGKSGRCFKILRSPNPATRKDSNLARPHDMPFLKKGPEKKIHLDRPNRRNPHRDYDRMTFCRRKTLLSAPTALRIRPAGGANLA